MSKFTNIFKAEEGNLLYLTMILMMILVLFTLGLTNSIIVVMHKIKAQQAADHLALSAASLKAQYLNQNANINSIISYWLENYGTTEDPFTSEQEATILENKIIRLMADMSDQGEEYSQRLAQGTILDMVSKAIGLPIKSTKVGLFPKDINLDEVMQITTKDVYIRSTKPPYYRTLRALPSSYEPMQNLAVQSRVEWSIQDKLIGQQLLPITLPIMTTKARAEIYDDGKWGGPLGRWWRVRLSRPDSQVDDFLKNSF